MRVKYRVTYTRPSDEDTIRTVSFDYLEDAMLYAEALAEAHIENRVSVEHTTSTLTVISDFAG
jgi:hypothetical protein